MAQTKEGAIKVAAKKLKISIEEYLVHKDNGERWCWKCKTWKLAPLFPQNSGLINAISGKCLQCNRVKTKKNMKGRASPFKGKSHTGESTEKMAKAHTGNKNHRWKGGISPKRQRDKNAVLARRFVNHAIEAGRLASPKNLPCLDCGKQACEYDHHRGYDQSNWLDVQAVCRKCHRKRNPRW